MKRFDVVTDGDLLTIRMDVAEVLKDLKSQITLWRGAAEVAQKQWEESEWYLGEARSALESIQAGHGALQEELRDLTARWEAALRERDEANWFLGEAHSAHAQLREQLGHERRQLAEVRRELAETLDRLGAQAARCRVLEAELRALRAHGERRGAVRNPAPAMTAELHSADGSLLYRGLPRNVSRTGFAFVSDQPLPEICDPVEITLRVPGIEQPIEAIGRLAWHEQASTAPEYLGGCELLDIPAECIEVFERVLGEANGRAG
jgi:hypothetical protein